MDFSQYSFDSPYLGFPQEAPVYHGQTMFGDFETTDGNVNGMSFAEEDGLVQAMPAWNHSQMQRFLKDTQRPLFNPVPQPQVPSASHPVTPIPPTASHHRQDSPFSSQGASNCSSGRSPRTDTELYTENTPSTPPDNAMLPSFQPATLEMFEPQSSFCLSGMGLLTGEGNPCVTMADVNSADEVLNDWKESPRVVDFHSPQRSYTFDSQASVSMDKGAASRHASVDQNYYSPSTPGASAMVKEEIHVPDDRTFFTENKAIPYPTPSPRVSDGSDDEIDVASPRSNDGEDDDDEYQPTKKRTTTSARRPGRGKRDAPAKPLEKNSPKKLKTASSASPSARPIPPSISGRKGPFTCTDCSLSFKDEITMQAHVKKQHTRPFICVFGWAGCTSTFASKNEWKRHVMSQDIARHYWVCDIDACAHTKNNNLSHPRSGGAGRGKRLRRTAAAAADQSQAPGLEIVNPPLPNGAIFNRKDLYTQHIRRMHAPANLLKTPSKSTSKKTPSSSSSTTTTIIISSADWDEQIKALQHAALRERCQLPTHMHCPAPHCDAEFTGVDAWDQRMEHVARHLERAALGQEEPVAFGGPADPSLTVWATRADVAVVRPAGPGHWALNNPLRAAGGGGGASDEGRGAGGRRRAAATSSMRGGGHVVSASAAGSAAESFEVGTPTGVPSVRSEILVEEDGEADAEGEEE